MKEILALAATGAPLDEARAEEAFEIMMSGEAEDAQIGGFLMALRVRGETVAEITAGARVLRAKAMRIQAPAGAVDTCGTGGDASGTYNISTAAAIITAACGVPVAKHGNRAQTSKSGSADILAALGVDIDADITRVEESIRAAGIGFLMAPRHHSAMRHVGPVRQALGTRTIFNLLGPLSNPAGAKRQLLGVFGREWLEPMARVLGALGSERAWIVHGSDGLDELTTTGDSHVAELRDGAVRCFDLSPEEAGLARADPAALKGGDAATNAAALEALLGGAPGAYRDIALLNAGAALVVADAAPDIAAGVARAAAAVDSGAAKQTLARMVAISTAADAA